MKERLPTWAQQWLDVITPLSQVILIVAAAWLLRTVLRRLVARLGERYSLPREMVLGARRILSFLVFSAALLLVLERLGVSGTVLWSALTGFAAVAAVAFFAAWSVLSNIFCTLLIFTSRLFRLHDHIELVENGEKRGVRGQVLDINLIYTTLREADTPEGAVLYVPNSLFFQRCVRRSRDAIEPVRAESGSPAAATAGSEAGAAGG